MYGGHVLSTDKCSFSKLEHVFGTDECPRAQINVSLLKSTIMTRKEIAAKAVIDGAKQVSVTLQKATMREDAEGRPMICLTAREEGIIPAFNAKDDDPNTFVEGFTKFIHVYPGELKAALEENDDMIGLACYLVASEERLNLVLGGCRIVLLSTKIAKDDEYDDPFREKKVDPKDHDWYATKVVNLVMNPTNKKRLEKFENYLFSQGK